MCPRELLIYILLKISENLENVFNEMEKYILP
jgi:hypothetical protein